ncbi:ATP-binding protein [Clavibacter michiganensis subsp. michiganensis]|uniref:sce7725 family protein n=1 Tax=Clavibacter michiganensis TaxID=28447 RepID=UPI001C6463CE|nr:sce7725 family protein [Clavibacter michiganensis]MBW8026010.1 ATP-binding protein [Clavibacter michiganensis subsp. michiganensis]
MYHPYFRGKQFELLALRESASILAESQFIPIIEPVRSTLTGLQRALEAVTNAGGRAIVIVNPRHGDHRVDGSIITEFLNTEYRGNDAIIAGALLRSDHTASDAISLLEAHRGHSEAVIHSGFLDAAPIAHRLQDDLTNVSNIFIEDQASMLYRRHFPRPPRILVRDGFEQKKNADYAPVEFFSDLHATYGDLGMQGYGDFLTVGDRFSEGGGPAYAVAIHLTFINSRQDNAMFVYHFVSDTNDTPTDPAGKFAQALSKLIFALDSGQSQLLETTAVTELRRLHREEHFPGLGYIKKLSINHHIETLSHYHHSTYA